jgi:hypothetical protein
VATREKVSRPGRRNNGRTSTSSAGPSSENEVLSNGEEELVLTASKQITIRCGESSITLTAAGKIILRGKYIVSRSSGVQRIKGGAVQIN